MHLKKNIHFNGKNFIGGVDLGEEFNTKYSEKAQGIEASEVLVFMVNAVNMKFRIPVAYFFINSLFAVKKEDLLSACIQKINKIGVIILNVTFDGPAVNVSMANHLVANIKPETLDPRIGLKLFDLPYLVVLFDPPHMIKLIRNSLASLKFLKIGSQKISWHYFEELFLLQIKTGLHLANKLTKCHVEWESKQMKVSYATRLFSLSIAAPLDYCRDVLKLPQFEGSEATSGFCRIMDTIFNIMNSSYPNVNYDSKAAISANNKEEWLNIFDETFLYIRKLFTLRGIRIIEDKKKLDLLEFFQI